MNTLLRAARLIAAPNAEWQIIGKEEPCPCAVVVQFVLPLSLLPGAGWSLGLLLFGNKAGVGRSADISGLAQIVYSGLMASFGVVLWICLSAATIVVLAPLFGGVREWRRAMQVAAYSGTPVLIAGLLLVIPDLMSILIIAFFHSLYLQYAGIQHVIRVKERDAAECVALSTMLLMVLMTAVGAAGSALGVL